jgi:hypothetical protein
VFVSKWTEQKSILARTGLQPESQTQGYRRRHCCPCGFLRFTASVLDGVQIRPSRWPIKEFDIGLKQLSSFLHHTRMAKGRLYLLQLLILLDKAAKLTKTTITSFKCPHIACRLHALLYGGSNPPNGYKTTACEGLQVLRVVTLSPWSVK